MLHYVDHCKHTEHIMNEIIASGGSFKYVIYPFGMVGKTVKAILNVVFDINEYMIVDNTLSKKYSNIKSLEELSKEDPENIKVLICSDHTGYYDELRTNLYNVIDKNKCLDLFPKGLSESNGYFPQNIQNIPFYLREMAFKQTCKYIDENMVDVPLFENRYLLLEYILYEKIDSKLDLFLEFGVYKGTSINFISSFKPTKIIYGFDSFEGLNENWSTVLKKGTFNLYGSLPEVRNNVSLVKGYFDDSLPSFLREHSGNCAFIHIDCDLYSSTKTVFSLLKNRIVEGTVIVFDEYFGYHGWRNHEFKAFQEFVAENDIKYEYLGYSNMYQVAIRITSL